MLTIFLLLPLIFGYATAEELDEATIERAVEKYAEWQAEIGPRLATVAGGQTVTLAWSELSPEQWAEKCPAAEDLIPK